MRCIQIDLKDVIIKKNKCMDVVDVLYYERKKNLQIF